ncbi:TonB-dependent receptor domain-containing protein [Anabaena sp. CCY 0017]|uniref:TonB-dependent receptor domain-containing protein n=1 Tax=Anabaena sp. CCY 0017 TaxID=3103866 RepID=UPI0039C5F975
MGVFKLWFPARSACSSASLSPKAFIGELRLRILSDRLFLAAFLLCIGLLLVTGMSLSFGAVAMTPNQLWLALIRQGDQLHQTILSNFLFGYTVLPNPDLRPETVDSYELGIRANYPQASLSLTGFYNRYDNFIETVGLGPDNRGLLEFQSQNIQGAKIYGLEARGEYRFKESLDGLSLFGTLAYAVGDNLETDQPLDSVDPFKAIVGLRYRSPAEIWGAELTTTLVAAKDRVSNENFFKPQGYTTVDLRSFYNFNENTTLNLGIFNLFNQRYTEWSTVRGVNNDNAFLDLYTQPGINFSTSLSVRF